MDAIDVFYPVRGRTYLRNGNVVSLVERAQEQLMRKKRKIQKIAKMNGFLMISCHKFSK
jgi:hypothetical protein